MAYLKKKYGVDFLNNIASLKENEIIDIGACTDLKEKAAALANIK